jgi:hypothetical protein
MLIGSAVMATQAACGACTPTLLDDPEVRVGLGFPIVGYENDTGATGWVVQFVKLFEVLGTTEYILVVDCIIFAESPD